MQQLYVSLIKSFSFQLVACSNRPVCPCCCTQVVLSQLSSQDHGSLRLVTRSLSQLTSEQLPYLLLRLSESSTEKHMQQWCQATTAFHGVNCVHVHIAGDISSHIFRLAIKLLSARSQIIELQLLAAYDSLSSDTTRSLSGGTSTGGSSRIPSLRPLSSLLSAGLQSLVIKGVVIDYLALDLGQLAAEAATATTTTAAREWQLQSLTLHPAWSYPQCTSWTHFPDAIMQLTKIFPNLEHLEVSLPLLVFSTRSTVAVYGMLRERSDVQLANITSIAALVNAALQLKSLQGLTVTDAPDIWQLYRPDTYGAKATAQQAALVGDVLASGKLSTLSAAMQALVTLDECCYWLLQHHHVLKELHISTARSGWGMSWRQQQQRRRNTEDCVAAMTMSPTDVRMRCPGRQLIIQTVINTVCSSGGSNTGSSSNNNRGSRAHTLARCKPIADPSLARYSPRSADLLMQLTTSCQLNISTNERNLKPLMTCFKNLQHLKVGEGFL